MAIINATSEPRRVAVVTPSGKIRMLGAEPQHCGSGALELDRNLAPRIRHEYKDLGWSLLKEDFATDPDPEIRANGWNHFVEWSRAVKAGTAAKGSNPKDPEAFNPFPDEWLPASVRARTRGEVMGNAPHVVPSRSAPEQPEEQLDGLG